MPTAHAYDLNALRARREEILSLCAAHGCSRAWVFGSIARGTQLPGCDVDLIVDLTGERTPWWPGGLISALEDALGVQVDVVRLSALPPAYAAALMAEACEL